MVEDFSPFKFIAAQSLIKSRRQQTDQSVIEVPQLDPKDLHQKRLRFAEDGDTIERGGLYTDYWLFSIFNSSDRWNVFDFDNQINVSLIPLEII